MPSFQLTELVDELARSSDDDGMGDEGLTPCTKMVRDMAADPAVSAAIGTHVPTSTEGGGPSSDRSAGERIASAFWRCAHEVGFTMLCEALTFSGLRDELPRLMAPGHTIIAPTNEAWARMDESVRKEPRLVRQLLLGHMCSGASSLNDLKQKNCAVAVAGQTHAVYEEGGHTCASARTSHARRSRAITPQAHRTHAARTHTHLPHPALPRPRAACRRSIWRLAACTALLEPPHSRTSLVARLEAVSRAHSAFRSYVGTGRFGRTDLAFDGGVIHEVTTVLMVLSLVRDSHSEQVWKKSLQPSPILSAIGGISNTGACAAAAKAPPQAPRSLGRSLNRPHPRFLW